MPWPTTTGLRNLQGAEADLVLGALGMMVDTHVAELREDAKPWRYGVEWFDQWEVGQRLWLLEQVTLAFFAAEMIQPAAIFDAAADAIFYDVADLVQIEIEQGDVGGGNGTWRQSVAAAFETQHRSPLPLSVESVDGQAWRSIVTQIADSILGVRLYRRAEAFRDVDYRHTERFLRDRGLPADYLSRIPPLRGTDQTQLSIDRIQSYVFR